MRPVRIIGIATAVSAAVASACTSFPPVQTVVPPRTTQVVGLDRGLFSNVAIDVDDRSNAVPDRDASLRRLEDAFLATALRRGFTVSARSDADLIRREAQRQLSGISEGGLARAAKLRGVTSVLIVTVDNVTINPYREIRKFAGGWLESTSARPTRKVEVSVSARLIGAEQGQVVWVARYDVDSVIEQYGSVAPAVTALAAQLSEQLPRMNAASRPRSIPPSDPRGPVRDPSDVRRLAIVAVDVSRRLSNRDGVLRNIEGRFMAQALSLGHVVVARDFDDDVVQRELVFQSADVEQTIARMGRSLRVDAVLAVSVTLADDSEYRAGGTAPSQLRLDGALSARMISTDGRVIWINPLAESGYGYNRSDIERHLSRLADQLALRLPRPSGVRPAPDASVPAASAEDSHRASPCSFGSFSAPTLTSSTNWRDSIRVELEYRWGVALAVASSRVLQDGVRATPIGDLFSAVTRFVAAERQPYTGIVARVASKERNRTLRVDEIVFVSEVKVTNDAVLATVIAAQLDQVASSTGIEEARYRAYLRFDFPGHDLRSIDRARIWGDVGQVLSMGGC